MESFYFIVDKNEVVEYNSGERNNREGEIVCKEYKNFNELPLELQEKFKSRVRGNILAMSKHGFIDFVNRLNNSSDELIGEYVSNKTKTQIKFGKCGHIAEISPSNYKCGRKCGICDGRQVQQGINDIATTHPHFVKYFIDVEDAYKYTHSSEKKIKMKCPNCGYIKNMEIATLTHQGFSCGLCSDGISYPEKLLGLILTKLNIEFVKQMSYDSGEHRYDFFLPKYNAIFETHGLQHYKGSFKAVGGKTLEEEQANDKYKRQLAAENGMLEENYHEIDCRYSTLEWCRPRIEEALSKYVDTTLLTDEDWKEVDLQAQKSLKIEVCKYWNEHKRVDNELTSVKVAETWGISHVTIYEYLKWGSENGFCTYNGQEEKRANDVRLSRFVYLIKPNGDKWFEEAMSMRKLSKTTGIAQATIRKSVNKGALKRHKNVKYDTKYIGSYIISADGENK